MREKYKWIRERNIGLLKREKKAKNLDRFNFKLVRFPIRNAIGTTWFAQLTPFVYF